MSMDKQTNIPLETTAKYQPLSNLDVNFYTRDIQTSILNFIVTRNHKPLLLGESNVVTNISLEFEDGSIVRDELTIKDGINGILSYTLSDEMLRHTGKVTGQVDIAIKGKEDTVVERLFSFNISKTLIDSIDAETKLIHIKRFSDLEKNITERYERMEETFANGENLAQAVLDASTKGLDDITSAKTKSLNEIKTSKDSTLKEITNTGSDYTNQLNTVYNTMDEKINKFNTDVQAGGYVKSSTTDNWQKYKLTEDDGQRIRISDTDPVELNSGFYQMWRMKNAPEGGDDNTQYWNVDVTIGRDETKQIIATISASGKTYKKNIHKSIDNGWKEITNTQTDTGWIPYNTINGVEKNVMYTSSSDKGFECAYRIIKQGDITTRKLRVNARNLTNGITFAELPSQFANNYQKFVVTTPRNKTTGIIDVTTSGELKFNYYYNTADWVDTDYIYGEFTWHD